MKLMYQIDGLFLEENRCSEWELPSHQTNRIFDILWISRMPIVLALAVTLNSESDTFGRSRAKYLPYSALHLSSSEETLKMLVFGLPWSSSD